jgi:hypothetical protein
MATLKADAEALRLGLILGLVHPNRVIAWADRIIMADRTVEAPVVLDLALAADRPLAELVSLLGEVPGTVDAAAVGRRLARQLREALAADTLDVVSVARAMYRLLREGYAPDREFESMAYSAHDEVDLALQGIYGTLEEVRTEVAQFLDRYADVDDTLIPPAA